MPVLLPRSLSEIDFGVSCKRGQDFCGVGEIRVDGAAKVGRIAA